MKYKSNEYTNYKAESCICQPISVSTGYPVVVTISPGLDLHSIEHIHLIEKLLDDTLLKAGYSRIETEKGGEQVVLSYYQCAIIGG